MDGRPNGGAAAPAPAPAPPPATAGAARGGAGGTATSGGAGDREGNAAPARPGVRGAGFAAAALPLAAPAAAFSAAARLPNAVRRMGQRLRQQARRRERAGWVADRRENRRRKWGSTVAGGRVAAAFGERGFARKPSGASNERTRNYYVGAQRPKPGAVSSGAPSPSKSRGPRASRLDDGSTVRQWSSLEATTPPIGRSWPLTSPTSAQSVPPPPRHHQLQSPRRRATRLPHSL